MAARDYIEKGPRRGEAAGIKRGECRKRGATRTRAAYLARALALVLDGPKERRPEKASFKLDSADHRCLRGS
jgi:hypothetical protein